MPSVVAQSFDFLSKGDINANLALKNYLSEITNRDDFDTVAFYHNNNLVGMAKLGNFHTLSGYKLFVLKDDKELKSDIYFDNTKNVDITGNKITYYKSDFYKSKKYSAKIGSNKVTTRLSFFDFFKNKKLQRIAKATEFSQNCNQNIFEISDFKANAQKSYILQYSATNEKLKH